MTTSAATAAGPSWDKYVIDHPSGASVTTSTVTAARPSWDKYVIDPNPSGAVVEKAWVNVAGAGTLDAVVGEEASPSQPRGGGLYWYQFPASGNPADAWIKHTIKADGQAREDIAAFDINGDGRMDIITSIDGSLYWFQNPANLDGSWKSTLIGDGYGENALRMADIDGDGKIDVVTSSYIFFQNSPTRWTRKQINPKNLSYIGTGLLGIGSGKGADNIVTTGPAPDRNIVWYENPREHGGDARTDVWTMHTIGPGYPCAGGTAQCPEGSEANVAAGDLNTDGRMDVVVSQAEGRPSPPGGLKWYEAPADRTQPWIAHDIDPSFVDVHNIGLADLSGHGYLDVVAGEQDQSPQKRVAIFHNDGAGHFTEQVLSRDATHNVVLGDPAGTGRLAILAGPHGYYGGPHPIEVYIKKG